MRSWLAAFLVAGLVMAGLFKAMPVLSQIPVDLTGAFAAATAVLIGVRIVRTSVPVQAHGIILAFALLIPAAFLGDGSAYSTDKISRLFTITLLATLAPVLLIREESDVEKHLWMLTVICGVVTATAILNPKPSGEYAGSPISAEGIDTIALGECAGTVLVVVALALMWRRIPWLVGVPVGGVALYALLQSGSRGPLVAGVLSIILASLISPSRPNLPRAVVVVVLTAFGIGAAFAAAPYYARERIISFVGGVDSGSVATRNDLFAIAEASILERPFGIGLGGFERIAFLDHQYPHNIVLEVLAEAGIVLGGLFLLWIAATYVRSRSGATGFAGCAVFALVTFMFVGALVSGDLNNNRALFYILGISIAIHSITASAPDKDRHPMGSR